MKNADLLEEVKVGILVLIGKECKSVCNPNNNCMLWRSSPEDLKAFSFDSIEMDLQHLSPFFLFVIATASDPATCAAASIALRGRQPSLSAFAYYVNSVL